MTRTHGHAPMRHNPRLWPTTSHRLYPRWTRPACPSSADPATPSLIVREWATRAKRKLGDACGLTRFGVNLVTLGPGGESALRHWHTLEDEFVYVLHGEAVLVTNAGEQVLTAGMCAGYAAGARDAHHFVNRSSLPVTYLEIGNRVEGDNAFYPDDDLMWCEDENGVYAAHKDGRRY